MDISGEQTAAGEPRGAEREPRPARRHVLKRFGLATGLAAGSTAGAVGTWAWVTEDPPAPASAASIDSWQPPGQQVDVIWAVDTTRRLVALTFDDGPMEKWTPLALDILDEEKVPATFFVVGSRLVRNAELIKGRFDRHEVGNHTWNHDDLSRMSHKRAFRSIHRTHEAIREITGKDAVLLRPPWGKLGGTTLHVASEHEYDLALWSLLVRDRRYGDRPGALVSDIVDHAKPGTIVLAHDVGQPSRLKAIRALPDMIKGLRARGFGFVTVSELRRGAAPPRRPR
ncbi:polysaccharide deacetylase family protein [Spirillospora sp. CA-294931]|uniref:polysaccharide deacetylase family protein n=1 Tax=Spirillospora sp. CA-294931 TaxID=3240042 RepID=UPI003D8B680D